MTAVRLIMMLPSGDDTSHYFFFLPPHPSTPSLHPIAVIIDAISLLYQVLATDY